MSNWPVIAAAAAMITPSQSAPSAPAPGPQDRPAEAAVPLEDVVVEGRRLEEMVREFVGEVGAPAGRRGLARWRDKLCVGVVNVRPDLGQAVADRVSEVALDVGLDIGEPGCKANVFIVFTDDGAALADAMVEESRRAFRIGVGGLDRGSAALEDFRTADRPVRWWHVSLPVNAETGARAVRLPADESPPVINIFTASRLTTQIRDDLKKTMVVVDVSRLPGVNLAQLADYLAFVTLVQVDPDAETAAYDTVLNLFDNPEGVEGMTEWDASYLMSLYETQDLPVLPQNRRAQTSLVAREMFRDRRDAGRAPPEESTPEPD